MKKRDTVSLIIILLAVAAMLFYRTDQFDVRPGERIQAVSFYGGLDRVSPEDPDASEITLIVTGSYHSEENPESALTVRTLQVKLNADTVIEKTNIDFPSREELEATGGVFNTFELPKETIGSSIRELVTDRQNNPTTHFNIYADADVNIYYEKGGFTASHLRYEIFNPNSQ